MNFEKRTFFALVRSTDSLYDDDNRNTDYITEKENSL